MNGNEEGIKYRRFGFQRRSRDPGGYQTITAHKMYAMTAITALTAQNTTGVYGVEEASPEFVGKQLDCIFQDIYPDAVKIGMVSSQKIIKVIAES